jgi:putative transposase
MPRKARLDAPGTLHHVIVRGIEGRNIVNHRRDREDLLSRIGDIALKTETPIYAWALLSNHLHILLRSGPAGLPGYMRRVLTGYAISYNLKHQRHGHLFQNRYKSIVCEEDAYFTELVRYIHLNPLRAGLVSSYSELNRYPWCGHGILLGNNRNSWQDRNYVLRWFGSKKKEAVKEYEQFVRKGVERGRRPELVGGGLVRSLGGWSAVKALRPQGLAEKGDERILGSGQFVERMLEEADSRVRHQIKAGDLDKRVEALINQVCAREQVERDALRFGSRRGQVSKVRSELAELLVKELGLSLAETARRLGVSTSGIAQRLRRSKSKYNL